MTLPAPQYTPVPNYCQNGIYPGFITVGSGTFGNLHTAIVNLESFIGAQQGQTAYIEVLSRGLDNSLNDQPGSAGNLQAVVNCPQHVVWAGPLVPMDGSVLLTNQSTLNSKLVNIGKAFVQYRNAGVNDTIRPGWEYNFSNYPWGINVNGNTYANIAAAMDNYITQVRAGGYKGRFELNGDFDHTPVTNLMTKYSEIAILGKDLYNGLRTSTYQNQKTTVAWSTVWTNEMLPLLNSMATKARADGKLVGFPECGVQITNTNHSAQNNVNYWTLLQAWIAANADIVAYITPYNQNSSGNEENQQFFFGNPSGTIPTGSYPNTINLGSQQNTSATGSTIVSNTYGPMASTVTEYLSVMKSGSMQIVSTPVTPPPVFSIPTAVVSKDRPRVITSLFG